jgi:hypothetical protein
LDINPESARPLEVSQKKIHYFVVFTQRILRHYRSIPEIPVSIPEKPFVGNLQKRRSESFRRQSKGHKTCQNDA